VNGPILGAPPPAGGGGAPGAPVLDVEDLGKRYGELEALRGVSFQVAAGERLAVIGPNGAGKTTLLSILAGVQRSSSGRLRGDAPAVGWVPQQPAVYSRLSVAENLRLFARLERMEDPEGTVQRMLSQTGLADRADELVGRLSGGNRQRVNVAIGLLSDPPVLLLDEPSSALDPRQRERLWGFIVELAEGETAVVFATHDLAEVQRYAERVVVLAEGEEIYCGSVAELAPEARIEGNVDFERAFARLLAEHGR
jgi:ABC-2 type transport system ATP-binding protein